MIIEDIFKKDPEFEQKCYRMSFPYYCRYLETYEGGHNYKVYKLMFEGVENSE